ncbi:MAG: hypothetical protein HQL46_07515 [Gammaproteobacteria bacterium]|nr:hypothetical protein [Gammaproteobacteria bacterium]
MSNYDPEDELLLSLGAKFIKNEDTRIVEINGRRYIDRYIHSVDDDLFEAIGEEYLNQTKRTNRTQH